MPHSTSIKIDSEILGGTPCFAGTRVPVKILFDYLEGGDSLDQFLTQYPSVHRDHAIRVLAESQAAPLAA